MLYQSGDKWCSGFDVLLECEQGNIHEGIQGNQLVRLESWRWEVVPALLLGHLNCLLYLYTYDMTAIE